ncbi:MAG TPA: RNA methyltransferase, partial [Ferruginibacter sp.]|nr:RNA methyltransferase [Ferruginibacter sp.]
ILKGYSFNFIQLLQMLSKSTAKYIQSLQHKKFRDETGCFVAEGPKLVAEFLNENNFTCTSVFALQNWVDENAGKPGFKSAGSITIIEAFELEKISAMPAPNQVLAVFEKVSSNENPDLTQKISLALDEIQDPGNLGTIIRTADWFGIRNIICSQHSADMYNPKVVQSTMASLGRVNIIYTSLVDFLKKSPVKKYATVLNGQPLQQIKPIQEGIIIVGNESKGISNEILSLCDKQITIERKGSAESLNAAVSAAIILYRLLHK